MTSHEEKAVSLFLEGANCSQAVFGAFSDILGLEEKTAIKMASSFGGGFGRMREVCGAVCGMNMVLGALYGYNDFSDKSLKTEHYKLVSSLMNSFKDIHGSYICREIMGLGKSEYSPVAEDRTADFYKKRPCLKCIATAARLLDEEIEKRK